jgi:hypothetical protein
MLAPGTIYVETELRLTAAFTDSDGVGIDPDTVTFKTFSPSGAEATYVYGTDDEVQRESAGNYTADIVPDEAGRWHIRWKTTGTGKVIAIEDDFIVRKSAFFDDPFTDYC